MKLQSTGNEHWGCIEHSWNIKAIQIFIWILKKYKSILASTLKWASPWDLISVHAKQLIQFQWNPAEPCGAPGHKSLSVSTVFLFIGNRFHSASRTFPEFQRADSNSCFREGRGCRDKGGVVKETTVQPWGRVLVPPQGIHITISLSCFADTKTPTRWKKLIVCCLQACRLQTVRTRRLMMQIPNYLTTNQSEECPWAGQALLFEQLQQNSSLPPPSQDTHFWGH